MAGCCGRAVLHVPWSKLSSEPVVLELHDVFLLAGPRKAFAWDEGAERKSANLDKLRRIDAAEQYYAMKDAPGDEEGASFLASLVNKIVDNAQVCVLLAGPAVRWSLSSAPPQVVIKRVHVRYEDSSSFPGRTVALGVVMHELSARSTNSEWDPVFIVGQTLVHKASGCDALAPLSGCAHTFDSWRSCGTLACTWTPTPLRMVTTSPAWPSCWTRCTSAWLCRLTPGPTLQVRVPTMPLQRLPANPRMQCPSGASSCSCQSRRRCV